MILTLKRKTMHLAADVVHMYVRIHDRLFANIFTTLHRQMLAYAMLY